MPPDDLLQSLPTEHSVLFVSGFMDTVGSDDDHTSRDPSMAVVGLKVVIAVDAQRDSLAGELLEFVRSRFIDQARLMSGSYPAKRFLLRIYFQQDQRHKSTRLQTIPNEMPVDIADQTRKASDILGAVPERICGRPERDDRPAAGCGDGGGPSRYCAFPDPAPYRWQ